MERSREDMTRQSVSDVRDYLLDCGACCVGFADIADIPEAGHAGYRSAVSIGLALRPEPIVQLHRQKQRPAEADAPVLAALRELAAIAVRFLENLGCRCVLLEGHERYGESLSDEGLAVQAGIAWIGKSSRPVTWDYGSAIRFASVLTDADLPSDSPTPKSFCGSCRVCTEACLAHAPSGTTWQHGMSLADFFNSTACAERRRELAEKGLDCRYCMSVCPFTMVYLDNCGIGIPADDDD